MIQNDNIRGIVLIVTAMAFFALTDTFVKLASETLPKGQVLFFMGAGCGLIFAALTLAKRHAIFARDYLHPGMIARNMMEIVATFSFITALKFVGLSMTSAIIQATPLAVTLAAIVLLRERVGWRRWGAILVGLFGVLVILRPGLEGFNIHALWAVLSLFALAMRDVLTRVVPDDTPSTRIAFYAMTSLALAGALHMALIARPEAISGHAAAYLGAMIVFGSLGYYSMVQAMRTGEISVVAPFRYARILFALSLGYVVFNEHPDMLTYVGAAITIAAGIYAFWREARLARQMAQD